MSGESISYPHHRHGTAGGFPTTTSSRPTADQSRTDLRSDTISQCSSMATCYPTYDLSSTHNQQQRAAATAVATTVAAAVHQVPQKDFNRPLHVDCSVEYELPNAAKPPQGVRNEPLLMIHPCYFRKIESQRRSPFVNNLPSRTATSQAVAVAAVAAATKRRHRPQQYPVPQYAAAPPTAAPHERQPQAAAWEPMPPLVPISQAYCKQQRDHHHHHHQHHHQAPASAYSNSSGSDSGHWTDPDRSPDRPEDKHILSGKYRQYLRHHRLHPYVTSAIPLASTFPQIQQVCYNV